MAFTHIQGTSASFAVSELSQAITLGAAPGNGHLVCYGIIITYTGGSITSLSITDGNNNSYAVTPNSPAPLTTQGGGTTGATYLAYLLPAPANADATITATWTGTTGTSGVQVFADEFSFTGHCIFDVDAEATSTVASTTITTPSITPTYGAGELLYSVAGSTGSITAPAAGATRGIWTGCGGGISNGDDAEYVLSSAAGASAVNYLQSSNGWAAMAMAFYNPTATSVYQRMPVMFLG